MVSYSHHKSHKLYCVQDVIQNCCLEGEADGRRGGWSSRLSDESMDFS